MFENVGGGEILLILLVILIFFGPKKIPELAQSLGKGLRKFNEAKEGLESQVKDAMKEPLEAMTGIKDGLESKLREAAEPLHAELKLPGSQAQPAAPKLPIPAETQARGSLGAASESAAEPAAPAANPAPASETASAAAATPVAPASTPQVPTREA